MSHPTSLLRLRDLVSVLERLYPPSTAQSWDQVGLVTGDADQPVRRVLLALDPTGAVIAEASEIGADLVITHHPLLLRGIHRVTADTAKGAAIQALVRGRIALYCAHTNADVAESGVGHALAAACGLESTEPLTISEGHELGRVGGLPRARSLQDFAAALGRHLPPTHAGIRVGGPPEASVQRVAVLGGAGDHAFAEAAASGADVYVTADLRHHPALEAREQARLSDGRPYLVDAGHYASEWLWLPVLARRLASELSAVGGEVDLRISRVCTDPWDLVLPTGPSPGSGSDSGSGSAPRLSG